HLLILHSYPTRRFTDLVRPRRRKAYSPLADGSQPGRLWTRPGDLQRVVTTPAVFRRQSRLLEFTWLGTRRVPGLGAKLPRRNTPSTAITLLPIFPTLSATQTFTVGDDVGFSQRMSTC